MKKTVISVTEAIRNFAECINRVRRQGVTLVLVKHGVPVARIIPHREKVCTGRDLAEALAKNQLSAQEAKRWHHDLIAGHRILRVPSNRWR